MTLQVEIIPVTPFQQNCCLLWDADTKEAVLTDVGGNADMLWARVQELGLDLQQIWLTHGHLDHAGGVVDLCQYKAVPVIGPHPDDAFWLDQLPEATAKYGFPVSDVVKPTSWLQEGDSVKVGAHEFQVLHIPGHTPGHVVFYSAEYGLIIGGDILFQGSIGRTDFPRGNHQDLISNIQQNLYTLPDATEVIPGHGPMTSIGHEKRTNPYVRAQD